MTGTPRVFSRGWFAATLVALLLAALVAPPAVAQVPGDGLIRQQLPSEPATGVDVPTIGPLAGTETVASPMPVLPDMAMWEFLARRAEAALQDPRTTNLVFEQLRSRIAEWRTRFVELQTASNARIETVRAQLAALGPAPEAGQTEPPEIAQRRRELLETLSRLEAPVRVAEEAFRRADGLIREIDALLRERQAQALLQLSPAPVNPTNWPAAIAAAIEAGRALAGEIMRAINNPVRQAELSDGLPAILAYLVFAAILLARGRHWMERATLRLQEGSATVRGREVAAFVVSLGQIVLPFLGIMALVEALRATGLVGLRGSALVDALPTAALTVLVARWLGGQLFPKAEGTDLPLNLPPERRREGRFMVSLLGLTLGAEGLRTAFFESVELVEAADSVLRFPLLALAGVLVLRVAQLVKRHVRAEAEADETVGFTDRLIGIVARLAMVLGVGGVLLGAVGYVAAAGAIVYPAAMSLGLVGLLLIVARVVSALAGMLPGVEDGQSLLPVAVNFALVLLSLPVFALMWGVRDAELWELYVRLSEGVSIGDTRISPGEFLTFAVVFAIGYTVTRLVQGALRSSVLPKTKLDKGGQTAVVSGLGYLGIFLAALIAFSSAGIDLSSLAIVAGALSVGIGFGLQNIVSNFVSGIILLFERPVAEGDWIEVGGVMGTVRKISVRSTAITTFDRTDVIVPNADLINSHVTNWTRFNLTGRIIIDVGVAYGSDTRKVARILQEIAEEQPPVILNPPPRVHFKGFGADALEFRIFCILRDVHLRMNVENEINHRIAERFAEEGIEIPFAQRDIWLRNPEALAPLAPARDGAGGAGGAAAPGPGPAGEVAATDTAPPADSPADGTADAAPPPPASPEPAT